MVESKVAVKLENVVRYDAQGNITTNPDLAYGLPTNYQLIKSKNVLFVNETGKNTNQIIDCQIGGQRNIVSADSWGNY